MKAEYFPPKVDIILQNEIPTDFYILVSGAVVFNLSLSLSLSSSCILILCNIICKILTVSESAGHADIQEWNGAGMLEQLFIEWNPSLLLTLIFLLMFN